MLCARSTQPPLSNFPRSAPEFVPASGFDFVCFCSDTQRHIATSVRMMREKGSLNLRTLHLILHGLPAAGKTCAKLRLTGQELTSRKPAERRDGTLVYPLDDGARSTPVAEKIV